MDTEPLSDTLDVALDDLTRWLVVLAVIVAALALNTAIRIGLRFGFRRAVRRAAIGRSRWRRRLPRVHDGASTEQRRLQRADAAAHMLARVSSLAIAIMAALTVTGVLGVDPVVLVSSAGFIGAGLAIGGQSVIKDWLTGLLVLLEDRYAVGDRVTLRAGGEDVTGVVETMSGAGVRLRLANGAAWHAGHGTIETVVNLSQHLVANEIPVPASVWDQLDETLMGSAVSDASHDLGLTDVVLLPDLSGPVLHGDQATVRVHASRPLSERQRRLVADRIARAAGPAPRPGPGAGPAGGSGAPSGDGGREGHELR